MKVCKICSREKPLSEYHKNRNRPDGVTIYCKPCAVLKAGQWQKSNRNRVNEVGRKNYAKNLEESRKKRRRRVRAWYQRNAEQQRQRVSEYRRSHPEKRRLSESKRRSIKLNNGTYTILEKELRRLLSNSCSRCGSRQEQTLDHIIPISRGGRHSIGNLQTLCKSCNSSKNNKTIMEWRKNGSFRPVG
jgi:5-methylcytosine-specific restriction endonuclease McrA